MDALQYAQRLIEFDSVSRVSNVGVTDFVQQQLDEMGFKVERLEYDDAEGVRKANVVAKRGEGMGGLAYFGHTDVVPADDWSSAEHGPFEPRVRDGRLFGRGACDMKGSVAAMLAAADRATGAELGKPLYIVCTADEEVGYGGAEYVESHSELYQEIVQADIPAVIGEPTRLQVVYAHKGTYGFYATSHGKAAHSSTRHGLNANLAMIPFLMEMKRIHDETESDPAWRNEEFDPPTISWNIGINDHTHAVNITPPQCVCTVYFRPMPGQDPESLLERVAAAGEEHGIEVLVSHRNPPVRNEPTSACIQQSLALAGRDRAHTVAYGTDGSRLRKLKNVVIYGPGDIRQAHTCDEWIALDELEQGSKKFEQMIRHWCQ